MTNYFGGLTEFPFTYSHIFCKKTGADRELFHTLHRFFHRLKPQKPLQIVDLQGFYWSCDHFVPQFTYYRIGLQNIS